MIQKILKRRFFLITLFLWIICIQCGGGESLTLSNNEIDIDGDGHLPQDDCNDSSTIVYVGAPELCDGIDNNCDGQIDEDATNVSTWYADSDNDQYGDANTSVTACSQPSGYVRSITDCDDTRSTVNPLGVESCNQLDDDCNGTIDDVLWYADQDGDGYGNLENTLIAVCQNVNEPPSGYADNPDDCDDSDSLIYPVAALDSGWSRLCPIMDVAALACSGDTSTAEPRREQPSLIKIGSQYQIYFRSCILLGKMGIGLATTDDLDIWSLYQTPPVWGIDSTLFEGDSWNSYSSWEKRGGSGPGVSQPYLLYDSEATDGYDYKLYYHAFSTASNKREIGCAVSTDGIIFKYGPCSTSAPSVQAGTGTAWDKDSVQGPTTIKASGNGANYHLYYAGKNGSNWGIGYATSSDGYSWTKQTSTTPLLALSDISWSVTKLSFPDVVYDPTVDLFIGSFSADPTEGVGMAYFESLGNLWTPSTEVPVLTPYDEASRWDDYGVSDSSLFIMDDALTYLMSYSGYHCETGSCVEADQIANVGFAQNKRPVIALTTPSSGSTFTNGQTISFTGSVDDDYPQTVSLDFESNLNGVFLSDANPNSTGNFSASVSSLSQGTHTIIVKATDKGGLMDVYTLTLTVQ